jgi:hypothetical protein
MLAETCKSPCRYFGARQLQFSSPSLSTAYASIAGGDLESNVAQHLRRLAKRDPTTRLKALQVSSNFSAMFGLGKQACLVE